MTVQIAHAVPPGARGTGLQPQKQKNDGELATRPPQTHGDKATAGVSPFAMADEIFAYQRDLWERSILFVDTLRQRADDLLAHERAGKPPLLDFDYELILDARRFEKPVNYALLRITRVGEDCIEDCLDPGKPPVVIIDPRAGHGPGIGGFKRESEVGVALREGHPVYFIVFFPEPCVGQTLEEVLHALRRFVTEVNKRHPGTAPVLYGNCQAGWAVAILAAHCGGLAGPTVLNGSPLSYWAGESGVNPMRISGGLFGGAWPAHFVADLGDGRFDGAWLVQNFESLKPEAVWDKYANLFSTIDSERERFLAFERWWGSFYFLSREEILAIINNLFVGNRLEQGTLSVCHGCVADMRNMRNPLIIFASYGDNITPPHQALGWIPVVYKDTSELKAAGQRIVYLINSHVGHLGIFVSASVAKLEHQAILASLTEISALSPGLYEMKVDKPIESTDAHKAHSVRFEERRVEDVQFPVDRPAFERVKAVSDRLDDLYTVVASKWVQAVTTPLTAAVMEWLHPARVNRFMFGSAFNPTMHVVASLAASVRADRHSIADDARLKRAEATMSAAVRDALVAWREMRDAALERMFDCLYAGSNEIRAASSASHAYAIEKARKIGPSRPIGGSVPLASQRAPHCARLQGDTDPAHQ